EGVDAGGNDNVLDCDVLVWPVSGKQGTRSEGRNAGNPRLGPKRSIRKGRHGSQWHVATQDVSGGGLRGPDQGVARLDGARRHPVQTSDRLSGHHELWIFAPEPLEEDLKVGFQTRKSHARHGANVHSEFGLTWVDAKVDPSLQGHARIDGHVAAGATVLRTARPEFPGHPREHARQLDTSVDRIHLIAQTRVHLRAVDADYAA